MPGQGEAGEKWQDLSGALPTMAAALAWHAVH